MDKRIKRIHQELELLTKAYANVKYDQDSTLTFDKGDIQIMVEFPKEYPFHAPTISDYKMQQNYNHTLHVVDIMDTLFSAPTRILILCHKKIVTGYLGDSLILKNHFYGQPLGSDESYLFNELFLPYFKNRGKVDIDTVDIDEGGTFQADAFSDAFIGKHLKWYDLILVPDCEGPWASLQHAEDLNPFFQLCLNVTKMLKPNGIIHFGKFVTRNPRAVNGIEYESCAHAVVSFLQKNGFTATLGVHDDSGNTGQYIIAQKKPVVIPDLPKKKPSEEDFFEVDVESDGNCFFYACWESARLQGISTLKDFAVGQLRQTKKAVLSTDAFPVVDGADKLNAVAQLLKGLDGLLEDKLQGLQKWKECDTLITALTNEALSNVILNPRRYAQQHVFATFMRAYVASSKEYKASLKNWKDFYETMDHELVEDNIEHDLSPHNSIIYYDNTLPVKEAVSKFADAMPAAFALDTFVDRLYVSAYEIGAVEEIFLKIGLNLNTHFEQEILPGLTIFAIKSGDHYVAGVPRKVLAMTPEATLAQIQKADFETKKKADTQIRKDESELRGKTQHQNKTARDDKFRTHQYNYPDIYPLILGGRNRTKKRRH